MSASEKSLSLEMRDAYDMAKANGGNLVRHAGGFWCGKDGRNARWFGATTAQALVRRDAAEYSLWQESYGRKFPVQLTIKPLTP